MFPHGPESDKTLEELAHRLRSLPPPPVPAVLEGRLLAAIPPRRRRRRPRFWLAAGVLLTPAACLLLALHLPLGGEVKPPTHEIVVPVPEVVGHGPTLWAYEQALRRPGTDALVVLDHAGTAFAWPVAGPTTALLSQRRGAPLD